MLIFQSLFKQITTYQCSYILGKQVPPLSSDCKTLNDLGRGSPNKPLHKIIIPGQFFCTKRCLELSPYIHIRKTSQITL